MEIKVKNPLCFNFPIIHPHEFPLWGTPSVYIG